MKIDIGSMEKYWFISDLHFGHENAIRFDNRPYQNVAEMNQDIVDKINETVPEDNILFIVGDVGMRITTEELVSYLKQIKCRKILVIGNHDHKYLKDKSFRDCFEIIEDFIQFTYSRILFNLMHFPIYEWGQCFRGSIHIYGHVHTNTLPIPGKAINVGCMLNEYKPYHINQIIDLLKDKHYPGSKYEN